MVESNSQEVEQALTQYKESCLTYNTVSEYLLKACKGEISINEQIITGSMLTTKEKLNNDK